MTSTTISEEQKRNWLDLPSDITLNILDRIGIVDILENVQKVCTDWHKICKDPALWRVINMKDLLKISYVKKLSTEKMFKHVVDRSKGQLVNITIINAFNAELLLYVTDRSSQLRRLKFDSFFDAGYIHISWDEVLMKFPLLEELSLYSMKISTEAIETAGRCCPLLKTFKVNSNASMSCLEEDNEIAIAIGENLHEVRHLQLTGNMMSNIGLQAILDGCPHLETLDLRGCVHLDPEGDVGRRCSQQIKLVKWSCISEDLSEEDGYDIDSDKDSDNDSDNDYDYATDTDYGYDFGGYPEAHYDNL